MASLQKIKMGVWGVQLNKGQIVMPYSRSTKDLYVYAHKKQLNTHNYFFHALLIGGPIALFLLLLFLIKMGSDFYKRRSTAAMFFVALLTINMFSENILYRHSGIFFVAVFMLFSYAQKPCSRENSSF